MHGCTTTSRHPGRSSDAGPSALVVVRDGAFLLGDVRGVRLERQVVAVVGKTKVADLLKSLPGYGPAKVSALLEQTGIDASRRAAGLGDRQKQALLDALS